MAKQQYFGTDGIRGRVGKSRMNTEFLLQLGWATGTVLAQTHSSPVMLMGRDTRGSGAMLQSALQAGLTSAGVDVQLLGVIPTPAVAYLTQSLRATAGAVISASHNPYYDNGVKFFNAKGEKLTDDMELAIEALLDQPMTTVSPELVANVAPLSDAGGRYSEFCKSTFPAQLTLAGLKIVVDCAHGATHAVAPMIFHELGASVIAMGDAPDGCNINQDCGATHLQALQQMVVEHQADIGIALDGDGDRLMIVDHHGEVVDGDEILCLLAFDYYDNQGLPGVVGTLMSNWGLEQAIKQKGMTFIRSRVGDRYVLEALKQQGWTLGGESSGHIVNLDVTTTGDGIVTALQVLRVLQTTAKPLHELKQCMQKTPQVMINVPIYQQPFVVDHYPKLQQAIADSEQALANNGRVLLRPSGTEPCVRVMVEGTQESQVRTIAESLADCVAEQVG